VPSAAEIDEALAGLRGALNADGYEMRVALDGASLTVAVDAGPEACAECLVPKTLMLEMIRAVVPATDLEVNLRYPAEAGE
jgi:hypothetical protein